MTLDPVSSSLALGDQVERGVDYLLQHFEPLFDAIASGIGFLTDHCETALLALPPWLVVAVFSLFAWLRLGPGLMAFTAAAFALIVSLGLWAPTMATLALVLIATLLGLVVGVPLGIAASRSDAFDRLLRPVLDFMQTMPAFVYLIPAAMFFGLGRVPGTLATVIFSMPPAVRLTNLGIRQVQRELVEAGLAFGCTRWQLLIKVQLPQALPSLMAGVNQTIMLALSMIVIASMIGAGGLGDAVLRGIQRMDIGLGFEGGLAVVLLAIVLDRITQSFGKRPHVVLREKIQALRSRDGSSGGKAA